MLCWLAAAAVWFVMSMMGMLMANDSGGVSAEEHFGSILLALSGQVLAALGAFPAGLSLPVRRRRSRLITASAILLAAGILIQWLAFQSHLARLAG